MVSGLRQRFTNGGIGCYLETSLLRTGMWIMGPHLSRCTSTNTSTQASYKNSSNSSCGGGGCDFEIDSCPKERSGLNIKQKKAMFIFIIQIPMKWIGVDQKVLNL